MKKLILLLPFFAYVSLSAQSFQDFIKQGDSFYQEEKYLESAEAYEKAFEIEVGNASQYYNAACSWALIGDTSNALINLDLSAEKGWKNLKHIKQDKDLDSLHDTQGWEGILSKVQANLDEYEKDFDKPLKEQLENIYVRDQTLRQLLGEVEDKFGEDSDELKYFWSLISEQDSRNETEVIDIIEERGWVGKSLVGDMANTSLWLVIQHAPLETQEKYLPMLRESVKKGESVGSHLALLEDRIQMRNGLPQTFGSQYKTDPKTGKRILYEIKDPEHVNQRRKEVGLGPIEDYVKRWGIEWTIEQKEK